MSDPTLSKTQVTISYTSSDKYRYRWDMRAGVGSSDIDNKEVPPAHALLDGLAELTRLCCLFGFADQARAEFDAAAKRIADWRATR
jgi:hypothetical protein